MISSADLEYAMLKFITKHTNRENSEQPYTTAKLGDGVAFTEVLTPITGFELTKNSLSTNFENCWMEKLPNLRRLVDEIERFYELKLDKGVKTRDIDLLEIAREGTVEQTLKLFEVVVATMMESAQKEKYIETIMSLDERSQSSFVKIINGGIKGRACTIQEVHTAKLSNSVAQYQLENNLMREDFIQLYNSFLKIEKENRELTLQLAKCEQQLEKQKLNQLEKFDIDELPHQNEQLKILVGRLKDKLMVSAIESETEVTKLKDQVTLLHGRLLLTGQMEETINLYKERYEEAAHQLSQFQHWEKERQKFNRIIEDRDNSIKKLQQRVEEMVQKNYQMEENQVYLKMELQKRQVRFKELEKEVKNRLCANEVELPQPDKEKLSLIDINREETEGFSKQELEKSKSRTRELQRENRALVKKAEKSSYWENEKKRLENMILELNKAKNEEIQTLTVAMYELREENIKMHRIIQLSNHPIQLIQS